jgi:hypothetical protein
MPGKRKYEALIEALTKRPRIAVTQGRATAIGEQWSRIRSNAAALGMAAPPRRHIETIEGSEDGTADYIGCKIAELDRWYREKEQVSESWYDVPTAETERNCIRMFEARTGKDWIPDKVCAVCAQLASLRTMGFVEESDDIFEVLKNAGAGDLPTLDECGIDRGIASVCFGCYTALRKGCVSDT